MQRPHSSVCRKMRLRWFSSARSDAHTCPRSRQNSSLSPSFCAHTVEPAACAAGFPARRLLLVLFAAASMGSPVRFEVSLFHFVSCRLPLGSRDARHGGDDVTPTAYVFQP